MANQTNNADRELDLTELSRKFKGALSKAGDKTFDGILFLKRNIILLIVVIAAGVALGMYMDRTKVYDTKIFIVPNFGSVDYVYSKVELINSKIRERDKDFYKETGMGGNIAFVKIEPVVDIYKLLESEIDRPNKNYELFKLIAENGDIEDVMEGPVTGRNYKNHVITIKSSGTTTREKSVDPVLKYINNSEYYNQIHEQGIKNLEQKIAATDTTLKQIDAILNDFGQRSENRSGNLVYYNDNTPLDEVIKLKNRLTEQQGVNRIDLVNAKSIVHETGSLVNIKDTKGLRGKNKYIVPMVFVFFFIVISLFLNFYRNQVKKRKANTENITE